MKYYYECKGKPKGPVSEDMLRQLHTDGAVSDATLIVGEGESAWVAYSGRMTPLPPSTPVVQIEKSVKEPISARAANLAGRAVSTKGPIGSVRITEFPVIFQIGEIFQPEKWQFFYRVCTEDQETEIFLYVTSTNKPSQGIVNYNTATTSTDGLEKFGQSETKLDKMNLDVHHIDIERYDENSWREHFVISIPKDLLDARRRKIMPMHITVMRPDEKGRPTKATYIEIVVPPEASAAVAYWLNPNHFEIMEELPADKNKASLIRTQPSSNTVADTGNLIFSAAVNLLFVILSFTLVILLGCLLYIIIF